MLVKFRNKYPKCVLIALRHLVQKHLFLVAETFISNWIPIVMGFLLLIFNYYWIFKKLIWLVLDKYNQYRTEQRSLLLVS